MKRSKIIGIGISFLLMCLFSCTNTSNELTGNGTGIGNPTIIGVVYQPGGKAPAQNAAVYLRNKNSLINIGNVGLNKKTADIAVASTNAKGEFAIDSIGPGIYLIECSDRNDNYALYDSVVVASSDSSIALPIDTLKPAGAIKGKIHLSEGGDFSRIYVLVFGVQRFTLVDTDGNFILDNLAEGNYKLRIISNLKDYDFLDTSMISVVSGDTTILDTVRLPFTGDPIVKNLSFSLDTLTRKVILSWDTVDTSRILGFNIYRCEKYMLNTPLILGSQNSDAKINIDTRYEKRNMNIVRKFEFIDSNVYQNQTYSYRVSIVDKDTIENVKSVEISVHIATYFSLDRLFNGQFINRIEIKGWNPNKFLNKNGQFYTVADSGVRVLDSLCNQVGMWGNIQDRPFEIAADNIGRIYLSCVNDVQSIQSIYVFNPNGILAKKLNLNDKLDSIPAIGIKATLFTVSNNGNIIFVNSRKDSIYVCDTAVSIIRKLGGFYNTKESGDLVQEGITNIITDQNNKLYVYEYNKGIKVFDAEGAFIRTIQTGIHILYGNSISVDPRNGNVYYCVGGEFLSICSPEGNLITNLSMVDKVVQNVIVTGNKIYITTENENISFLTGKTSYNSTIVKLTNNLP